MSNKTQLQTNNASLDEFITRINAAKEVAAGLPEAGGGGGGGASISTTDITVNGQFGRIYATSYVDGTIVPEYRTPADVPLGSISNVISGSALIVLSHSYSTPSVTGATTYMNTFIASDIEEIFIHLYQVD